MADVRFLNLLSYGMPPGNGGNGKSMNVMPLLIAAIVFFALAYRFYFSFIAAKIALLHDTNVLPSSRLYDGQNYYPMNKWVLFGHHFAAIAGVGPLVGPVLGCNLNTFRVSCGWTLAL